MARRYCGQITIYLVCNDTDYSVRVVGPGGAAHVQVGFPAVLTKAVDSPDAFDEAAHAALSFIQDDQERARRGADLDQPPGWTGHLDLDQAATTDSGWMVTRKPLAELLRGATP